MPWSLDDGQRVLVADQLALAAKSLTNLANSVKVLHGIFDSKSNAEVVDNTCTSRSVKKRKIVTDSGISEDYSGVTGDVAEGSASVEESNAKIKLKKADTRSTKKAKVSNSTTYRNGLRCTDLVVGAGKKAESGKVIEILYTGTLENGKVFDSKTKRQRPFKFRLGINEVITGLDRGIEGMKVGGIRQISMPPTLGYGSKECGPIPANSKLTFDVELVKA